MGDEEGGEGGEGRNCPVFWRAIASEGGCSRSVYMIACERFGVMEEVEGLEDD